MSETEAEPEAGADDDDEEQAASEVEDSDGDVDENGDVTIKTPGALRKEGVAKLKKQAVEEKKNAKKGLEDGVSCPVTPVHAQPLTPR